jgi:hypothetical protein
MSGRRRRVTVDLPAGLAAAAERTGLPLAELIRRGIYGPPAWPAAAPPPRRAPQPPPLALVPADRAESAPAAVTPDRNGRKPDCRPRCPQCAWRALQPVRAGERTNCEACGFGFVADDGQVPR